MTYPLDASRNASPRATSQPGQYGAFEGGRGGAWPAYPKPWRPPKPSRTNPTVASGAIATARAMSQPGQYGPPVGVAGTTAAAERPGAATTPTSALNERPSATTTKGIRRILHVAAPHPTRADFGAELMPRGMQTAPKSSGRRPKAGFTETVGLAHTARARDWRNGAGHSVDRWRCRAPSTARR